MEEGEEEGGEEERVDAGEEGMVIDNTVRRRYLVFHYRMR